MSATFNKRKLLYLILCLLLILAGGLTVVLFRDLPNNPTAVLSEKAKYTVVLKKDGFFPDQLTIHQGDIVKFTTSTKDYFWPASDLHPTHELYPAFDPQEPIDPKQSWSFKFDKLGRHPYHDHLAPYYTGVITVIK